MKGAIDRCRELAATIEGSFVPQQFENNANPCFHEHTTAREIIEQMNGRIDAVVIGAEDVGNVLRCFEGGKKTEPRSALRFGRAGRDRFTVANLLTKEGEGDRAAGLHHQRSTTPRSQMRS